MKRSNDSKWDDGHETNREPSGPAHVQTSGVRRRASVPQLDEKPCATFDEVYRRYRKAVWARIHERLWRYPSAAEDAHQVAFMWLHIRIQLKGGVPNPIGPVLFGLVEDAIVNQVRSLKRRHGDDPPDSQTPSSKPNPEQLLEHAQHPAVLRAEAEAIFSQMRPVDADLIKLAHQPGLGPQDVAERFGVTMDTLRVKLSRARARFRELYERHHGPRRK
jgi:RNA polymerase sigma factor (sigma-70 family)